eukprot:g5255.t1
MRFFRNAKHILSRHQSQSLLHSHASPNASLRNADENAVFVVNGASRGIGLALATELIHRTKGHIVGTCRDVNSSSAEGLRRLHNENRSRLSIVALDVERDDDISTVTKQFPKDHVDLLINCAGILHDENHRPERSLSSVKADWATKSFRVNTLGPLLTTQAMTPLLRAATKQGDKTRPSLVANISARVGSIADNGLGGWYSYRISKAAQNQATKCMALELKRQKTYVIALHPGTVETDLSSPFKVSPDKLFSKPLAATQLLDVIDRVDIDDNGGFFDWEGKKIEW